MSQVTRIVHRRTNPGQQRQYENLVREMLAACSRTPGYLFSTVIPPRVNGEEFHIVQCFSTQAALDAWASSKESVEWHKRLREVSDHDPEYRVFKTSDLWFSSTGLEGSQQPARWRMAVLTWLGIFPTASLAVAILFPLLGAVPYIPRMMIVSALVVFAMYWFIMPRLLRWLGWWVKKR